MSLICKLTPEDRITKASVMLQQTQPFFSYILMNMRRRSTTSKTSKIKTMCIDIKGNFFFNPEFVDKLTDNEIIGCLVHETLHLAKDDFYRRGTRDPMIWNIASDMVINYMIMCEGFCLPSIAYIPDSNGCYTIKNYTYCVANRCTEEVYDMLYQNIDQIKSFMQSQGIDIEGGNGSHEHGGFDIHSDENLGDDPDKDETQPYTSIEKNEASNNWKQVTIEAVMNARCKKRGNVPGSIDALVNKILNPIIDWRTVIHKFVTNEIPVDYTNRLPGRKFYATGIWMPSIKRENVEVFISVDYSGSTIPDRQYFINEVSAILASYEQINARLIFWDAYVNPLNDFLIDRNNKNILSELKIHNCNGGTTLSCYAQYCEEQGYNCRLHIILTDGYVESAPTTPEGKVIFVLTKNGTDKHIKELGEVCWLDDKEY
jgi:predicted metal-dependent peptidase